MNLQTFYTKIGGNYDEAMKRLMKEERIVKYLNKIEENVSFDDFLKAIEAEDWSNAFLQIHSLKGIALNLELGALARTSSDLCEMIRHGKPETDISGQVAEVKKNYQMVMDLIKTID